MRIAILRILLCLSVFVPTQSLSAQPQGAIQSRTQEERETRILTRTSEYRVRLEGDYRLQIDAWSQSFLASRRVAINQASVALAAEAEAIRTARRIDWNEVAKDDKFRAFGYAQVSALINPARLREELNTWARGVEDQTRREMLEYFRQLIAEDLGAEFDAHLRGRVVEAVRAIPLETLVTTDQKQIEASLRNGLPGVAMTRGQREALSLAVGALAYSAGFALATAVGIPQFGKEIASVAVILGQIILNWQLESLDRKITGEPKPALIARQLEAILTDWQRRQLQGRLEAILAAFGSQVIEQLRLRASQINLQEPANWRAAH